jgi:hypothetical protein
VTDVMGFASLYPSYDPDMQFRSTTSESKGVGDDGR